MASSTRQAVAGGAWGDSTIAAETAEAIDGGGGGSLAPPSSSLQQQPSLSSRSNSLTGGSAGVDGGDGDGGGALWIVLPMLAAVLPLAPPAVQQGALTKASDCLFGCSGVCHHVI